MAHKWLNWVWEPLLMLRHVATWLVVGSLTGVLVGVVVTFFLKLLFWSIGVTATWPLWSFALALPLGGLVTGALIHYLAPDAAGHGTEAVIRAVHLRSGQINWKTAPIKALATVTTIAAGGSAGKEGPSAQIGAAVASALADLFRFPPAQRRRIVICGIGAGFAAVFGTPVAGAVLGIEVLAMGEILYDMLLPSFAASIAAYEVALHLGLTWFYPQTAAALPFSVGMYGRLVLLGLACGLVAYALVVAMESAHRVRTHLLATRKFWPPLVPAAAGMLLFVLVLLVGARYTGLSLPLLTQSLAGVRALPLDWLGKLVFVAITLGFGMSGGIITPLFVIGATLGATLAAPFHLPIAAAAEVGMVAVTAAGANAPIASILLGMEVFGSRLAPDFLMAVVPAFFVIGHHSVYPSQVAKLQKSPWVPIRAGEPLESADETDLPVPWIRGDGRRTR